MTVPGGGAAGRQRPARARPGRSTVPAPALALAAVAVAFFALPLARAGVAGPVVERLGLPHRRHRHRPRCGSRCSARCGPPPCRWSSAFPWPGCWPGSSSRAGRRCGPCARCRWCCPRWWAAWPCSSPSAAGAWSGQYLDRWFGFRLPFTTAGVVVAQTFVAMPFLVITVEAALRQLDGRYEEASRTLGASSWYTFRRVTLPAIRPALVAGAVLAWARALGEFGATITFAGNFPGTDPDHAAGRLPGPGEQRTRGGDRPGPGAHRRLLRRAGGPPRPVAGAGTGLRSGPGR